MDYRILITEPIIDSVIEKLGRHFEVDVGKRGDYNEEQKLADDISEYDGLLSMLSNPVTSRIIEEGSKLKIIANHAVGYNNIDLQAAKKNHTKVANTPDVLTESSADCALALMLNTARKICEAQQYLRDGHFNGWEPLGFLGMELNGRTLGILGMGRIGTAIARRAKAFGLTILYHNRSPVANQLEEELDARYVPTLKELATQSDILSINCPLTEETHHLINENIFQSMPGHAFLINTARGAVVDEEALGRALHRGAIGGAGLDVFENEPRVHPDILTAPNCVITPHIASATHQTRKSIGMLAANAIIDVLKERPASEIPNLLDL